jgi:hypothetical protein
MNAISATVTIPRSLSVIGIVLLLLVIATPVSAQFVSQTTSGTAVILAYAGPGGAVTIPDSIDGLQVSAIGNDAFGSAGLTSIAIPVGVTRIEKEAFLWNSLLGSLAIPDGVTNIGEFAFAECTSLTNLTLGNNVTRVEAAAFADCSGLASVTIPNNTQSVEEGAFLGCSLRTVTIGSGVTNLGFSFGPDWAFGGIETVTNILVDPLNETYSSLDGVLFNKNRDTLLAYPPGTAGEYIIPNAVTTIGGSGFSNCTNLNSLRIGNNTTKIASVLFAQLTGLTNITVDPLNPSYSSIDGVLFTKDRDNLIFYPPGKEGSYIVPDGVTSIDYGAFANCAALTAVVIPDSVTTVAVNAFQGCASLASVTIGRGLLNLENPGGLPPKYLFADCPSLTNVTVDPQNSAFSSNDGLLFDKNQEVLIRYPAAKAGNYEVPDSVTYIPDSGFVACHELTSVVIPNSVTNHISFSGCNSLTNLVIPNRPNALEQVWLNGCSNLVTIRLPDAPLGIPNVFSGLVALQSVEIPGSVTYIDSAAFSGSGLTSIRIPAGVVSIGPDAFLDCSSLTNIAVDPLNQAYSSSDGVLFDKSQRRLIRFPTAKGGAYVVPSSVTNVEVNAFSGCSRLTNVILPGGIAALSDAAFQGCVALMDIIIPNGVSTVGFGAFADCTNLRRATFLGETCELGESVFGDCTSLREVKLPSRTTTIPGQAFVSCVSLTDLALPETVTGIGFTAFAGCTGLTSVRLGKGLTNLEWQTFSGCTSLTNIILPDSLNSIGDSAFSGCVGFTSVTIPKSLTHLGDHSFSGCTNLISLFFTGNAPTVGPFALKANHSTIYYLPGTSGWGSTFAGRPALLWNPLIQVGDASFAGRVDGFAFNIAGTPDIPLVVEATSNLTSGGWASLRALNLTNGLVSFTDPEWTNHPGRFYRLRSP